MNVVLKIISPKIDIKRFFQNEEPEETILNLIKLSKPNNLENTIFSFQTTDTNSPIFEIIESIPRYTNLLEPIFKINSNEEGVISFQGSCVQDNKTIKTGENEIIFEILFKNSQSFHDTKQF